LFKENLTQVQYNKTRTMSSQIKAAKPAFGRGLLSYHAQIKNYYLTGDIQKYMYRRKLKKYFLRQLFKDKKKLYLLTGFLKMKTLKNLFLRKRSMSPLFKLIEFRLDVSLVRSLMISNINVAKKAIKFGYVYVNKTIVVTPNYILRPLDIVSIKPDLFFSTNLPKFETEHIRMRLKKNKYVRFMSNKKKIFEILKTKMLDEFFLKKCMLTKYFSFSTKVQILFLLTKIVYKQQLSEESKLILKLIYDPGYKHYKKSFNPRLRMIINRWLYQRRKNQ